MGEQWLLIGGVAHGQTMWIKCGNSVLFAGEDDKMYQYIGHGYVLDGRLYRIGALAVGDVVPSVVEELIRKKDLQPLEGGARVTNWRRNAAEPETMEISKELADEISRYKAAQADELYAIRNSAESHSRRLQ